MKLELVALTEIKSKQRENFLKDDDEMRTCLKTLDIRVDLISTKQAYV